MSRSIHHTLLAGRAVHRPLRLSMPFRRVLEGLLVLLFVAEPVFAEGRCVPGISLIPHYPKVMDPNEAAIPLSERVYPDVVTFVNLDNDDDDGTFDNVDDEVAGGDNELIKVTLEVPAADGSGTVCLDVPKGGEYISVWTNRMKSANAALPLPATFRMPADFSKGENSTGTHDVLRKDIWVEGIAPYTIPTNTQLRLTHEFAPGQVVTNLASITVVGVESVRWKGRGNSVRDGNDLDEDPNWPTGLQPGSVRVFPGARSVDGVVEAGARDTVDVEVTLSVPTPRPVDVFLKSFDVDDPTADETDVVENHWVDREEYSWDNRGREPAKDGRFVGDQSAAHVCALSFPAGTKTASAEFQTTLQPGDNFRIVANADSNFLKKLENADGIGMSNSDKQRICHKDVSGTFADREIRNPDKYASNVLTVWRFFHLEVDTMENPAESGPEANPNIDMDKVKKLFKPAYIIPVIDGGGNPANNTHVPFRRNLSAQDAGTFLIPFIESNSSRKSEFWAGYGLYAYQPSAIPEQIGAFGPGNPPTADRDPDQEKHREAVKAGLVGVVFWCEVAREKNLSAPRWARTFAHEMAHILGAEDNYYDGIPRPNDIMGSGRNNEDSVFQPAALDAMRSFSGNNKAEVEEVRLLFENRQ